MFVSIYSTYCTYLIRDLKWNDEIWREVKRNDVRFDEWQDLKRNDKIWQEMTRLDERITSFDEKWQDLTRTRNDEKLQDLTWNDKIWREMMRNDEV